MKIAILSDIHEDVISLELALQKIKKQHCEAIVCLGDISGYNVRFHNFIDHRDASACWRILIENRAIVVAGNHDLHVCKKLPFKPHTNRFPEDWYQLDHPRKFREGGDKIWLYTDELDPLYSESDIQHLHNLPMFYIMEEKKSNILFSHYLYPNLNGSTTDFYESTSGFLQHLQFMKEKECTLAFCGHVHVPGLLHFNKLLQPKSFNKKIKVTANNIVLIPPVVRSISANGFCIFDTEENTVIALRI
ncbi:MAG: metallophosphoesterase family protein [Bacteroidota bacterium]